MHKNNLIFIHIPKTAGSTLNKIIKSQFANKSIFKVDGFKEGKSIEELKKLDKKERNKIRCVMGHMNFGVHKYLPRSSNYITVLRNPVDRLISLYYFILRQKQHPLHESIVSNNLSLEDFVNSDLTSLGIHNVQTRMLAGNKVATEAQLNSAKKNLQKYFTAVGLTEKFDRSLELFSEKLGWQINEYKSINVNQNRPQRAEVSQHIIQLLEEKNSFDMELYEFADRLLIEGFFKEKPQAPVTQEPTANFFLSINPA
jgi:hypothetical protein